MAREPIWTPISLKGTAINAFRLYVNRSHNLNLLTYQDLHAWSVNDVPVFAEAIFRFVGIKTTTPYVKTIDSGDEISPLCRWFPSAKLNFTENLLGPGLNLRPNGIAVTVCEEGSSESLDVTFLELERRTVIWAATLKDMGFTMGDRVAGES